MEKENYIMLKILTCILEFYCMLFIFFPGLVLSHSDGFYDLRKNTGKFMHEKFKDEKLKF